MRILLVNDDGYQAEGTLFLKDELVKRGHEVYSFLPEENCSGYSFKASFFSLVGIQQEDEYTYIVKGTPIDSLQIGYKYLKNHVGKPDLIISGINEGLNYCNVIPFSGTVSAALDASSFQIPSVALSYSDVLSDTDVIDVIDRLIHVLVKNPLSEYSILNVNIVNKKYWTDSPDLVVYEHDILDKSALVMDPIEELDGYKLYAYPSGERNFKYLLGVINKYRGFVLEPKDLEILEKLTQVIR